jgi:acetyl esterase/lipase
LRSLDFEYARKQLDALGAVDVRLLHSHVVYAVEPFGDFEAEWALPLSGPEDGVILYLHGGSYTCGGLPYAKSFGGVLARDTRRLTLCVAYRLAPEHPFPAALDDAAAAYSRILERYPSQKIAVIGESAGGGLSIALALRLKELGMAPPACIAAISPWADLTCSGRSFTKNAGLDPCLFADSLLMSAECYSGGDTRNPLISPLFADFSDMPDTLVFAGSDEMLLDDSVALAERYGRAGSFCELHIADDMWHAYVLFGLPESKLAMARICEFIEPRLLK